MSQNDDENSIEEYVKLCEKIVRNQESPVCLENVNVTNVCMCNCCNSDDLSYNDICDLIEYSNKFCEQTREEVFNKPQEISTSDNFCNNFIEFDFNDDEKLDIYIKSKVDKYFNSARTPIEIQIELPPLNIATLKTSTTSEQIEKTKETFHSNKKCAQKQPPSNKKPEQIKAVENIRKLRQSNPPTLHTSRLNRDHRHQKCVTEERSVKSQQKPGKIPNFVKSRLDQEHILLESARSFYPCRVEKNDLKLLGTQPRPILSRLSWHENLDSNQKTIQNKQHPQPRPPPPSSTNNFVEIPTASTQSNMVVTSDSEYITKEADGIPVTATTIRSVDQATETDEKLKFNILPAVSIRGDYNVGLTPQRVNTISITPAESVRIENRRSKTMNVKYFEFVYGDDDDGGGNKRNENFNKKINKNVTKTEFESETNNNDDVKKDEDELDNGQRVNRYLVPLMKEEKFSTSNNELETNYGTSFEETESSSSTSSSSSPVETTNHDDCTSNFNFDGIFASTENYDDFENSNVEIRTSPQLKEIRKKIDEKDKGVKRNNVLVESVYHNGGDVQTKNQQNVMVQKITSNSVDDSKKIIKHEDNLTENVSELIDRLNRKYNYSSDNLRGLSSLRLDQLLNMSRQQIHHVWVNDNKENTNSVPVKIFESKSCQTTIPSPPPAAVLPPPPLPQLPPAPPPPSQPIVTYEIQHPCHSCCPSTHCCQQFNPPYVPSIYRIPKSRRSHSYRSQNSNRSRKQLNINHHKLQKSLFEMSPKYSKTISRIYEEASKSQFTVPTKPIHEYKIPTQKSSKKYRDLSYLSSDWTSSPTKDIPDIMKSTTSSSIPYTTPYTMTTTSSTGTKSGIDYNTASSMDDCRYLKSSSEGNCTKSGTTTTTTTTSKSTTTFLTITTTDEEDLAPLAIVFDDDLNGGGSLSDGEVLSLGEIREFNTIESV